MPAAPEVVEKPGDNSLSKLKTLYIQAKELSENEVAYVLNHTLMFLKFLMCSSVCEQPFLT